MLDLALCLVSGVVIGHVLTRAYDAYVSTQLDRELTEKLKARLAQLKERIVNSRIEEVNGSLFLFNQTRLISLIFLSFIACLSIKAQWKLYLIILIRFPLSI